MLSMRSAIGVQPSRGAIESRRLSCSHKLFLAGDIFAEHLAGFWTFCMPAELLQLRVLFSTLQAVENTGMLLLPL